MLRISYRVKTLREDAQSLPQRGEGTRAYKEGCRLRDRAQRESFASETLFNLNQQVKEKIKKVLYKFKNPIYNKNHLRILRIPEYLFLSL